MFVKRFRNYFLFFRKQIIKIYNKYENTQISFFYISMRNI
mgnify:CR=1 FL=1|jgi:hypothetical protein